ncbi:MAG: hypothetical protein AAGH15_17600 [Myxococcota bacterium]
MTETKAPPRDEDELKQAINAVLRRVRHERAEWDTGLAELHAMLNGPLAGPARHLLEAAARRERLEFQWKLEELLDATAAPSERAAKEAAQKKADAAEQKAVEDAEAELQKAKEAREAQAATPLRPEDLVPIYEDPRGIVIHRHIADGRWVLTQINPMTGQPQSVELSEAQKTQVRAELAGSPYWLEGAGAAPAEPAPTDD